MISEGSCDAEDWSNDAENSVLQYQNKLYRNNVYIVIKCVPVAQWFEHCVSSAKVVGSIPREHMYWQYKCVAWMLCKSLWIKASAKCKCNNILEYNCFYCNFLSNTYSLGEHKRLLSKTLYIYKYILIISNFWLVYLYSEWWKIELGDVRWKGKKFL